MPTIMALEKMSVAEKIQMMESLWDSLCTKADDVTSPSWHGDVLSERDALLQQGCDRFQDWDEAKQSVRNRLK